VAEYRIDELARRAGTSVRNVRVYQDRGLLAPPRRQGRVGWYGDAHLERLRLIGRMLERGYTFATIRELLAAWSGGAGLGDVLGLGDAIRGPWTEEEPGHVTLAVLRQRFGPETDDGFVAEAVRLGLLEHDGPGAFRVPSPQLLDAGAEMVAAGVPLTAVLGIAVALRTHLDQVAELIFTVVASSLSPEAGGLPRVGEVADVVARLRPHALRAAQGAFGLAMRDQADQVLADLEARARADSA
jgi:DNA-binding transcriptional MerR regulator